MIEPGDTAPDFELPDQDGNPVRLSDLRGGLVVLYFYPKADTPGCTTQACGVRDHRADYDAAGATVLGVSPDPVKAVKKFHDKQALDFTLLADEDHAVAEQYGVWAEKSMYGRTYMGNAARDVRDRRRGRRAPRDPEGLAQDARRRGPRRARHALRGLVAQAGVCASGSACHTAACSPRASAEALAADTRQGSNAMTANSGLAGPSGQCARVVADGRRRARDAIPRLHAAGLVEPPRRALGDRDVVRRVPIGARA